MKKKKEQKKKKKKNKQTNIKDQRNGGDGEGGKEEMREGERYWRNTKVRKSRDQSAEPHTISFFRKRSLDICCTHYIKFRSAHKSMVKKRRMGEWGGGEGWRDVGEMGVSPPVHLGQNKGHGGDVLGKVIFYKGHHKPWARQHSKSNKSPVCAFRILRNDYFTYYPFNLP